MDQVCPNKESPNVEQRGGANAAESDDWGGLIRQIELGNHASLISLYLMLDHCYPSYLRRRLGFDIAQDKTHDLFLMIIEAVRGGRLEEPAFFECYIRGIARNQVKTQIKINVRRRHTERALDGIKECADLRSRPEETLHEQDRGKFIQSCLAEIGPLQREILERFYLRAEPREQILQQMDLSPDQYRLLKWRAKAALSTIGRKRLRRLRPSEI